MAVLKDRSLARHLVCCLILVLLAGSLPAFSGLTVVIQDRTPSLVVNICHPLDHAAPVSPGTGMPLVPSSILAIGVAPAGFAGIRVLPLFSRANQSPDPPPPKLSA